MDVEDLLGFENLVHILISAYCKCILENNTEYHPHSLKNNTECTCTLIVLKIAQKKYKLSSIDGFLNVKYVSQ